MVSIQAPQAPIVWKLPSINGEVQEKKSEQTNELKGKKKSPLVWNIPNIIPSLESSNLKDYVQLYREPVITFCITPNNTPEMRENFSRNHRSGNRRKSGQFDFNEDIYQNSETSDLLLNTINGLFQNFYPPERVRLSKQGVKVKMNDVVSYKIAIQNGVMKFYLSVPKKWASSFKSAIKKDWGQVDITEVNEEIIKFNPSKARAMEVHLRHHYALSIKHDKTNNDSFYSSISSLASTLGKDDKLLIDYNIEPTNDKWKGKAVTKVKEFKNGKAPNRDELFTVGGIAGKVFDMFNVIMEEFSNMIGQIMGADKVNSEKTEPFFDLKYTDNKVNPHSKGYKMQIRVIGESEDDRKIKHAFRNLENSFALLDGDNKFTVTHIKTKRGIKSVIHAVEQNKPIQSKKTDVYFDKEMKNVLKMPNKETLKEFKIINQDNFTRSDIDEDFFNSANGAIPFATTLDKVPKKMYFGGYVRDWWTELGRYTANKKALDDRSTTTMVFGRQGSGKTSFVENQALYTFGAHIKDKELWKTESKSVVIFDVADGLMINNIYNHVQEWQKDRVVVLNHSNFNHPIAVNNSDLMDYNTDVMKDEDYAYSLAEMEAKLVLEILKSDKTISMDRWFTTALQCIHSVNKDFGYIEAMRTLIDDDFRREEIMPKLTSKRLQLEMNMYDSMAGQGGTKKIVETIQNRFSSLERDQKLWDCIAQKPIRDENGKTKLSFRQMLDGDENGAYLILIYIPKEGAGVSGLFRKFIFAHYFTKIWSVLMSRAVGFGGREYRPETLIVVDEVHQILDIPYVANLFIDLFKEPRKYSARYMFTLHGWSSLSKAPHGLEGDIRQSIMDNGCNLIMLKGGGDAFESLEDFLQPYTLADFNNLMGMEWCGIFALRKGNMNHVFQAKMISDVANNKDFTKYRDVNSNFLIHYCSEYGKDKPSVRDDNLNRSYAMLEQTIKSGFNHADEPEQEGGETWEEALEKVGMKEKKSKKSQ